MLALDLPDLEAGNSGRGGVVVAGTLVTGGLVAGIVVTVAAGVAGSVPTSGLVAGIVAAGVASLSSFAFGGRWTDTGDNSVTKDVTVWMDVR